MKKLFWHLIEDCSNNSSCRIESQNSTIAHYSMYSENNQKEFCEQTSRFWFMNHIWSTTIHIHVQMVMGPDSVSFFDPASTKTALYCDKNCSHLACLINSGPFSWFFFCFIYENQGYQDLTKNNTSHGHQISHLRWPFLDIGGNLPKNQFTCCSQESLHEGVVILKICSFLLFLRSIL